MGNISSRPDEGSGPFIRDQMRFTIASVHVTNSQGQTLLRVVPTEFPATTFKASKDAGDESPIDYIQDPEGNPNAGPSFLMRLANSEELHFQFTLILRQQASNEPTSANADSHISGLTYVFASSAKELDNLITREFHSDPNLHKNSNVELLGDYNTGGSQSVQIEWNWKWRPPKTAEDRGGGWRNTCSFVEYNQRAHRLDTLASFTFWVQNTQRYLQPRSPQFELGLPPRLRVPSGQSMDSRLSNSNVSDSEGEGGNVKDFPEPQSPVFETIPENGLGLAPMSTQSTIGTSAFKVDVATCKPGEESSWNEDGPLFRATMRSLEQRTGNMRLRMKKVLRTAEAAEVAQQSCNQAVFDFTEALKDAAHSNEKAVRPALDHYFDKIAREILAYERRNAENLRKLIIDPVSRLYNLEIKSADNKKREFDEESKEYYSYVSKYLGQRSESLKEKKQQKSDEKYQAKRRTFELKRFDYSSFMHDLHGGRKDQEVLSHLTKYANAQAQGYLATAKKVEEMVPQLDALVAEVKVANQDFELQRSEREEKRRILEKSTKLVNEDGIVSPPGLSHTMSQSNGLRVGDADLGRMGSTNGMLVTPTSASQPLSASPNNNRFRGYRDLEDGGNSAGGSGGTHRKEGLLWAMSRPGGHAEPLGINKAAWHKFWIVLDQGKLSEYVNWKDKLDLHMDPIDLRMASVREARNSERRFCFEVITPHYTRVYQAPSEDDMKFWIAAINNAVQSAFENRAYVPASPSPTTAGSTRKDIAAVLTGKSSSFSGHRHISNPNRSEATKAVNRYATTGDKNAFRRNESSGPEPEPSLLLQRVRSVDEGNKTCADCASESRVDWCSINLGVLLCIECSGIHRSLGTHISKVRSLTLDTSIFTPDLVEVLLSIGNRVSNTVWEARLDRYLKPSAQSTREQRLSFITSKYGDRAYVQTASQSPDDHLLTSIKKNDIQSVLHALALRANPNAHDRSRATHAIFLALAAADPAAPGGSSFSQSSSTSTLRAASPIDSRPSTPARKAFAIAELLVQNGAEIPAEPSPFPLSTSAKQYLDFKNDQKLGKAGYNGGIRDGNGDQLGALPANFSPSSAPARERERLVKRNRPSMTAEAVESFVKK
ncbi:hypothetical protein BDY17DRAFT_254350 [Neohortaea acidophila]|uniref:ADP-ribosylation factor GTPase-activating protein n=1 Tax=Neohortaea acidophila TaxID=245834 RepID=A0A6A6PLQ9_9PEZI|nr:uncharacterized protein BDY17DRAFT_254350 [Neohortaea acidophila]KAF2480969.1 hypothetical protein BDY17DRAFT_254350 [Neohortaea acidophila]